MRSKKYSVETLPKSIREAFPQAKTVSDSNRSILINVTPVDQKGATPQDGTRCAMARACKRQFKADGVWIGLSISYILRKTHLHRFATPVSVSREITSFDRHQDFSTGIYRLSKIGTNESQRLGWKKPRSSKGSDNSKTSKGVIIPRHFTTRVRGI